MRGKINLTHWEPISKETKRKLRASGIVGSRRFQTKTEYYAELYKRQISEFGKHLVTVKLHNLLGNMSIENCRGWLEHMKRRVP